MALALQALLHTPLCYHTIRALVKVDKVLAQSLHRLASCAGTVNIMGRQQLRPASGPGRSDAAQVLESLQLLQACRFPIMDLIQVMSKVEGMPHPFCTRPTLEWPQPTTWPAADGGGSASQSAVSLSAAANLNQSIIQELSEHRDMVLQIAADLDAVTGHLQLQGRHRWLAAHSSVMPKRSYAYTFYLHSKISRIKSWVDEHCTGAGHARATKNLTALMR